MSEDEGDEEQDDEQEEEETEVALSTSRPKLDAGIPLILIQIHPRLNQNQVELGAARQSVNLSWNPPAIQETELQEEAEGSTAVVSSVLLSEAEIFFMLSYLFLLLTDLHCQAII